MKKALFRLASMLGLVFIVCINPLLANAFEQKSSPLPCTADFTNLGDIKLCPGECYLFDNQSYCNPGEYRIEIPDSEGCIDTTRFLLVYGNSSMPGIDNLTILCNPIQTAYTVSFTILGIPPFFVNGMPVPNTGSLFISSEILSGSPYFFEIEHSGDCPAALIIQDDFACDADCLISAGTLDHLFRYDCDQQSISISHHGDEILEADDLLQFILYSGNSPTSGQVLQRSNTGMFPFLPGDMTYGTPYHIVAIAGNKVNGAVDLYDHCLSLSDPIEITFFEAPELVNTPRDTLLINCNITEVSIATEVVKGSGQFTMHWQGSGLHSDTSLLVTDRAGTFYFKLVDDYTGCVRYDSAVVIEDKSVADIQFAPVPVLDCLTPQVVIDASQSSSHDSLEYSWQTLDGNIIKIAPPLMAVVDAPGTYTLFIKDLRNGCTAVDQVMVKDLQDGIQSVQLNVDEISCNGDEDARVEILGISGGHPNFEYTFGGVYYGRNKKFENLSAGFYSLQIVDSIGCQFDTIVEVKEPQAMDTGLEDSYFVTLGESIRLEANANFKVESIVWLDQKGTLLSDSLVLISTPNRTTPYRVQMVDYKGCRIQQLVLVRVGAPTGLIYIPNAFSPNGDQNNDQLYLYPHPSVKRILSFKIYSRWGDLVFACENIAPERSQIACSWDGYLKGQEMKPAVFVYIASLELLDGSVKTITGDITLIR